MAYVTGTSTTLANLLTDIRSACTANGWTLSGDVLHKGGIFQRLVVNGNFIDSWGGTGKDGSNVLTGVAPSQARIGSTTGGMLAVTLVFPLKYEVFIGTSPDEVHVVVNYSTDRYQWLSWGMSSVGVAGSGGWFSGSFSGAQTNFNQVGIRVANAPSGDFGSRGTGTADFHPALFHAGAYSGGAGEHVNHGIVGGTGWSVNDTTAAKYRAPLDYCLPSAWNSETVLLPIQVFSSAYGSSKVALVLDVAHARAVRIDNHRPGDIITLGADRWKVYPWYSKGPAETTTSSGRLGWAIRYDGP